jgi:hypothetical protein
MARRRACKPERLIHYLRAQSGPIFHDSAIDPRESLGGKPVVIKRLPRAQDAPACHILFINSTEGRDLKDILAAIDDSSVLTVSDMPDFSKRGGMIQFVSQGDRIRFEINLDGAERSHLIFPSELLKVAVAVKKPTGSGE